MITITKIEASDKIDADFILCPNCKRRLCDKVRGTKAHMISFSRPSPSWDSLLIKCSKCGNRYLISSESE